MKRWRKYAAGLLLMAGVAPQVRAQAVVPAAPPAAAVPVAGAPVAAPAPAPANLWSFICLTPEQKLACKEKICNCALGQMLNNGLKPMGAFSGGIIGPFCPEVRLADLAKPADSAEGAAARIKADEADAKARREAVRYLGTVDCNYWPEAQEALAAALRGDRNECVRLEAAYALLRGCCCTKITIKALLISVSGSDEDGFPRENSERVRAVAHGALGRCLACYTEVVPVVESKDGGKEPPPPKPGEPIPPPKPGEVPKSEAKPSGTPDRLPANIGQQMTPAEFYKRAQSQPREQLIEECQRVLGRPLPVSSAAPVQPERVGGSIAQILQHAFSGSSAAPAPVPAPAPAHTSAEPPAAVTKQPPPKVALPGKTTTTTLTFVEPSATSATVTPKIDMTSTVVATPAKPAPAVDKQSADKWAPTQSPAPAVPTQSAVSPVQTSPQARAVPPSPVAVYAAAQSAPGLYTTTAKAPAAQANNGLNMTLGEVVKTLSESPHPEYRVWAADNLATVDGWTNPEVVQALARAARTDQTPSVRAACVRTLGRMRCATMPVLSAIQSAKGDPDPRVRQEADQALQLVSPEGMGLTPPASGGR
jgi:hypothetical protein